MSEMPETPAAEVAEVEGLGTQRYKYEIDQESLNTVFGNLVSGFGGRKFVCDSKDPTERMVSMVESLLRNEQVTGCKLYNNTLLADKTFDETQKTVVVSSFVNLLFLNLNKTDARKVVLSHQMRDRLTELFTDVAAKFGGSSVKVLTFKTIDEKMYIPTFVEKNKKDFVFVKIVMKLPNNEVQVEQ